jgi:cell surface protein SprA
MATYTVNQFQRNLDYSDIDFQEPYDNQSTVVLDQSGNYKNEILLGNVNLMEQFSPLIKVDMEFKSSLKLLAEIRTDRMLSLSFDNNLLTEIKGKQYTVGLGYRVKDLKFRTRMGGGQTRTLKSDLNMKADISMRDNLTTIRYLDLDQSQVTAGQTIWSVKYQADYAFSKNLTGILYFDYNFSEYAISTVFPQTTIRSGITLKYNFGN